MRSERAQHRKWLIEFGALSLALTIVVGLVLGQTLGNGMRERASESALREAQVLVRAAIEPNLGTRALRAKLPRHQRIAIDRALRANQRAGETAGVVVRSRRGERV